MTGSIQSRKERRINNDEDRLLISPPETNLDVDNWQDRSERIDIESNSQNLEDFRKKLEDLL